MGASESIEEDTAKTFAPITWVKLPLPPAPRGDFDFPVAPTYQIVGREKLPNVTIPTKIKGLQIEHYNRVLTVEGKWDRVVEGTATPNPPFKSTESITTGSSKSTSYELGYSLTASASILFASVESTLSASFGQTFTFSAKKTVSQEFWIISDKGMVTVCWWQGNFGCTYTYNIRLAGNVDLALTTSSFENIQESVLLQVMVGNAAGKQLTEKFTNRGRTFISTQYPPVSNRSSLGYDSLILRNSASHITSGQLPIIAIP